MPTPAPAATARRAARHFAGEDKPDRRLAILLTAERLFAEHGYRTVTIRQIAKEAGVPLALVGYYFGPKQELFHAIFEHWRHTIDERVARLAEARANPDRKDPLTRIVLAFVEPVLRMRASEEGEYYARLVARELAYRTPDADRVLSDYFDPMAFAFIDALLEVRPGCSRADAAWAYQFSLGALIHHISDHRVGKLSGGEAKPNAPEASGRLATFIAAGIAAVLGSPTTTPRKAVNSSTTRRQEA